MVEKEKEFGFRLDEWFLPSAVHVDDIVVLAISQQTLEPMILDLTEGFKEMSLEVGHATTHWS